jgi:predicted nucleic acid-binding protein
MRNVIDACALIAYLRDEEGAEVVEALLLNRNDLCVAHVLNLCEVFYDFLRVSDEATALSAISDLESTGLIMRDDIDVLFWQAAGTLKAKNRASIADCFAIALAKRIDGIIITSDHHEFDALVTNGVCTATFIR